MKINKLILILSLMLLISLSLVSAVIDFETDVDTFIPLANYSESTGLQDLSPFNVDGVANGGVTFNTAKTMFDFDGVGDYVQVDYSALDNFGSGDFAISQWIKSEVSSGDALDFFNKRTTTGFFEGIYIYLEGRTGKSQAQWSIVGTLDLGTSYLQIDTNGGITDASLHHVFFQRVGTNVSLFVDGLIEDFDVTVGNNVDVSTTNYVNIGSNKNSNGAFWKGDISDVILFNKGFTKAEISALYTKGQNYNPYVLSSSKFQVTAKDFYDDASINSFWADIDGTNYTTTNGTINTALFQNDTSTYTLIVGATDYFSKTYSSLAVTSNKEAELFQSEISFDSFDLVSGSEILSCNYTIDSVQATTFYLSEADDYVALVECPDYYDLNYTFNVTALDIVTLNVTGLFNRVIAFNITDIVTGDLVDVNTTILINYTSSSWSDSFSAVNGTVEGINLSQLNYTALISSVGYAPQTVNISVNNSTQVFSYSLYSNNSVWITAVDFDSALELTNFSVTVSNDDNTYSGSDSDSGIVRINDVAGGVYTVRVTKSGYAVGEHALTMTGGSHQNVIAYLSSAGSTTIFTIVDSISSQIIEGATGNMYKSINSSYTLVSSQTSDITGRIQYSYTPDIEYKFVMDADGYEQRTFFLKPLFGSYTIRLTPDIVSLPDLNTGAYVYEINNSGLFHDDLNNSFEISISSGTGTIEYYNLTVTNFDGTPTLENCAIAQGCSDSFTFEIVNADFEDVVIVEYVIKESGRSEKYFKKVYHVQDVYDPSTLEGWKDVDDADVDSLSKAFIAMIVCLIVVAFVSIGSISVGVPPVTASGFVLALLVEVFAYVGFIPNLAGHLVALGCIMIVIFGRGEI